MTRILRYATPAALAALLLGVFPLGAGAAGGITIDAVSRSGDTLLVSGGATFDDQPFLELGTDGTGDTFAPGQDQLGADLTGAHARTKANGQIELRWSVTSLPPVLDGPPTGHAYGWTFCVDEASCFDVDAQRTGLGALSTGPYGALWRCADPSCTPADQSFVKDGLPVVFDGAAATITVTLNAFDVGAQPGSTVNSVSASGLGPAFVWTGDASLFVVADFSDGVLDVAEYEVASKRIDLALGAPGQDPASVSYSASVSPGPTGSFSYGFDVGGLAPGDYEVYARACFGEGNCAFASAPVTLS